MMFDEILNRIDILTKNAVTACQESKYDQGIEFQRKACELAKGYLGTNHPNYATTLNNLAMLYYGMGSYKQAERLFLKAKQIKSKCLGTNHPVYVATLKDLAFLYHKMGSYKKAKPLLLEAELIIRQHLGTNNPVYTTILNDLARLYNKMGSYEQAEGLLLEAKQIISQRLGTNHPVYAVTLNDLAFLYQEMGSYKKAEPLLLEAKLIISQHLDTNHPDYATILNSLASLYTEIRSYEQAERLLLEAKQIIISQRLGTNHPVYASTLKDLASLYYGMGDYEQAKPLLLEAKQIISQHLDTNHPDHAAILNDLSRLYYIMEDYEQAKRLLLEAKQIVSQSLGTKCFTYARLLDNLALLYQSMGRYKRAEFLFLKAKQIRSEDLVTNHPIDATLNLALLYVALERPQKALLLMQEAAKIQDGILGQIFSVSADNQRLTYLRQSTGHLDIFLSLVTKYLPDEPQAIPAAFDLIIRRKALGIEAAAIQRAAILSTRYHSLAPQLEQLQQIKRAIANLTFTTPSSPEALNAYHAQLANLYQESDEKERFLSSQIPEMNMQQQLNNAERQTIAQALPEGATLVEFVRFSVHNFAANLANGDSMWLPARYVAFILPARQPEQLQMIDLKEAEPIDELIRVFRKSVSGERSLDLDIIAEAPTETDSPEIELRKKLIDPLKPYLKPHQQLFLSPDGELAYLPFGVLPAAEGEKGLLMEAYQLCYLSVGRDLLRYVSQTNRVQPSEPLVIADPDYNLSDLELGNPTKSWGDKLLQLARTDVKTLLTRKPSNTSDTGEVIDRSLPPLSSGDRNKRQLYQDLRKGNRNPFKPLPGTRIEGERVAKLLKVEPHLGAQAVKSLVSGCQSPRILHLATHGYFLDTRQEPLPQQLIDSFQRLYSAGLQNPLMRSGLAFAGANTFLQGGKLPPTAEDGLLTAFDASSLNLEATALVVTAACQTALGEVSVGEGVLGLRRALILAGAQTLVMSLWSVPDVPTAILMEQFYHYLLAEKMGRAVALEKAQLYVRDLTIAQMRPQWLTPETINAIGQRHPKIGEYLQKLSEQREDFRPFASPLCWGAFICIGNPSPLS